MVIWGYYVAMLLLINFVPRLRRVAVVLFALVVIKHAYGITRGIYDNAVARKLILPSEAILFDLKEERDMNFRKLHGRVTNKSQNHSINTIGLKISYKDCPVGTADQNCTTIGAESAVIMKTVLPGETAEFNTFLSSSYPVANRFLLVDRTINYIEASKNHNESRK